MHNGKNHGVFIILDSTIAQGWAKKTCHALGRGRLVFIMLSK